ncbi:accelerated cell death 11-like [Lycium ferocissimum]|uniref:accelerated cell death 11-like n=1 Tax=Lycium ferocissimum TaxID=112874 RepID=UPI002814EF35|nr:accelerated cell death 11-like [Lycium ferocissimum]
MEVQGNPMRNMVEVLEQLEKTVRSENHKVDLQLISHACNLGAQFASSFFEGFFEYGAVEIEDKAKNLKEAATKYITVEAMLDYEISNGLARNNNSHTRFLLRVKRSADLLRVFFQGILAREGDSLVPPLRKAYDEVFGAYHGVNTKSAVYSSMEIMELLVDKTDFFHLIDNNATTAREVMQRYISASTCVCQHAEQLYRSTKVGEELLRMI